MLPGLPAPLPGAPAPLADAMRCAPTTRRFTGEPVERAALLRALELARFAPSGGNRQPWRVIVVEDADRRARLAELYLPHWRAYLERTGAAALLREGGCADEDASERGGRARAVAAADAFAHSLAEIPVHLVVWVQTSALAIVDAELERPSISGGASIYPFVQNLLLALRAEGLGAALTTLLLPAEREVRELLEVPAELALAAFIAVGHRAGPWPSRLKRRPVEEFASLDRWGQSLGAAS